MLVVQTGYDLTFTDSVSLLGLSCNGYWLAGPARDR